MSDVNFAALVPLGIATAIVVAALALGLALRRTALPALGRAMGIDASVIAVLRGPVVLWSFVLGSYVAARVSPLPGAASQVVGSVLMVLLILSVAWTIGKAATLLIAHHTRTIGASTSVQLISSLTQALVLLLGALVALNSLGVSIAPLLTALGVGGLAVGLALQDTLANLFAGIHILLSRQVRPGDLIRLESGEEGNVQDITWRYTTVRQPLNNILVVPNAKLASAIVKNFELPDPELAIVVPVGVSYASDLAKVEAVTVAVAKEVLTEVQGGVPGFEPFIRYDAFSDSRITFNVVLRSRQFGDQGLIRHEFIKRLHVRFQTEGIDMPFPTRTVHLHQLEPPARGRAAR